MPRLRGRRRSSRRSPEPVYQITQARRGVADDVDGRARRYLISMGVRTACFVLAVVTHGWLRWVLVAGALVLPYVSVVFANGGRERAGTLPDLSLPPDRARPSLPRSSSPDHDSHGSIGQC